MKRPPMLMRVKIQGEDSRFGLWLPLFLLWPLVLVFLLILSPLILVAVLILWPSGWGKWALLVLRAAFEVFCSMRGLQVDICDRHQVVYISVV
ncbi:MAG: hypothetical protein HY670_07710 [Chloroflexi bacterium]|nr:hypothetical protein [Chloroflexota bacterium]